MSEGWTASIQFVIVELALSIAAVFGKACAAHIPLNPLSFKALLSIADDLLQCLGGCTLGPNVEILANHAGGNPRTFETLLVAGCHCLSPDGAMQVSQQEATASTCTRVQSHLLKQVRACCHRFCMMLRQGPPVALCSSGVPPGLVMD